MLRPRASLVPEDHAHCNVVEMTTTPSAVGGLASVIRGSRRAVAVGPPLAATVAGVEKTDKAATRIKFACSVDAVDKVGRRRPLALLSSQFKDRRAVKLPTSSWRNLRVVAMTVTSMFDVQ